VSYFAAAGRPTHDGTDLVKRQRKQIAVQALGSVGQSLHPGVALSGL